MKHIAVIPARGGSKRLPRKNLIRIAGVPLIVWTIRAARECGLFHRIVVSTDDREIASVAEKFGVETPFLRLTASDDVSTSSEATLAALIQAEEHWDEGYDTVTQLMPTCPLRTANDIRNSMNFFSAGAHEFQLSCADFGPTKPWWACKLDETKKPVPLHPEALKMRSQDLDPLYSPTGAIWIASTAALKESKTFYGPDHVFEPISWRSALDIDSREDIALIEALLSPHL